MSDVLESILQKVSQIDALVAAQQRQEATLERLSDAVTKLAVIEERQNMDRSTMQRVFAAIDALEKRILMLERAEALNERLRYVAFALVGTVSLAVLYAMLKLIGLYG